MKGFSVTPLGTVSPFPTKKCNCPGFLVQNEEYKILLDCGSGVSRYFNNSEDLKNLMIILSHLHVDHFSDLGSLAYESYVYHNLGMLDDKLKVYFPYHHPINNDIMNLYSKENNFMDFREYTNLDEFNFGDMKISFFRNLHDVVTFAVKIMSENVSLVYTSDTGYNSDLIYFCENVDLLISEATFLRGQKSSKYHMYAWEAGKLAMEAKVKKLMLTHFGPNIDKKLYVKEAKKFFKNTIAAEEGKKFILRKGGF